jgi:hypothetical protein
LAAELRAIEDLWPLDRAAAIARLAPLTERVEAAWSDEALLWSFAANAEETLIELSLPSPPRLKDELSREELLELVHAWWSASRERFDVRAEAWFRRVLEANLIDPSRVPHAQSPEDFLARALALPPPAPMPAPRMSASLREALRSWLAGALPPEALFDHVERHGASLGELLDVLTALDDEDGAGDDEVWAVVERAFTGDVDPVGFFARHLGVHRTQTIADASAAWRGHDVRAHLVGLERRAVAWAAVDRASVADAYNEATACDPATRSQLLERLAATRPLEELVTLAARLDERDVPAVRASLTRRAAREQPSHGMDGLILEAIEASWSTCPAETVLAACACLFDVAPSVDEPALALIQLWADAADHARHSLASATAFAAGCLPPDRWLPLLRPRGLRASTAALRLLEAGQTPLDAGRGLRDAGYGDDDVFAALRSNGVANVETLTVLRECGWQPARMVDVLAKRDELPTEVRDRLRSLGLGDEVIRSLLAEHWDPATVALVVPSHP